MVDVIVIGAGPYGLSIAAHLRQTRLSFRVFGKPMTLWRDSMPKGMLLKSDGFATNLAAPGEGFPLERFYRDTGRTDYSHIGLRIPVETLVEYGLEFQRRCMGSVDEAKVVRVSRVAEGFDIGLDTGEQLFARKVVVAVGPLAFKAVPQALETLSGATVSHSSDLHDLASRHYSREMRDQSQAFDIVHNYANGLFDEVFCNEISGPGVWWPGPISGGPMNYSG